MPYLNLAQGEPWAETWGTMHFPEDEAKRRSYIARLWSRFYPIYEKTGAGEPLPRSVLLSVMEAAEANSRRARRNCGSPLQRARCRRTAEGPVRDCPDRAEKCLLECRRSPRRMANQEKPGISL